MFEYAAALAAERGLPVSSTVILLRPPAPATLVYEERVRGRVTCFRRIRLVRLWRMEPARVMRLGPGGAALVGLMGRPSVRLVERAARRIAATAPARHCKDLSAILRMLSEGRYTARELERIVPDEVVMSSSLVAMVKRRSRAEGRAEASRALCMEFATDYHPEILPLVAPLISGCTDPELLHDWARAAPRLSDEAFLALVRDEPAAGRTPTKSRSMRGRAPRPARRARSSKRR